MRNFERRLEALEAIEDAAPQPPVIFDTGLRDDDMVIRTQYNKQTLVTYEEYLKEAASSKAVITVDRL